MIKIPKNEVRKLPPDEGINQCFCISGVAEHGDHLYRIVSIEAIINRYKDGADQPATTISNGGIGHAEND